MDVKRALNNSLHKLADSKFADWTPVAHERSTFRKPVRIMTVQHINSLMDLLTREAGWIEIKVGNNPVQVESVGGMTEAQLSSIDIRLFREELDAKNDPLGGYIVHFGIGSHQAKGAHGPGSFMSLHVPKAPQNMTDTLTIEKAQRIAEACTEVIPWRVRGKPYGVVNPISADIAGQRKHDRRMRWQAAWISFGISAIVAVISWILEAIGAM